MKSRIDGIERVASESRILLVALWELTIALSIRPVCPVDGHSCNTAIALLVPPHELRLSWRGSGSFSGNESNRVSDPGDRP